MCVYVKKKYNKIINFREISNIIESIDSFDKFYNKFYNKFKKSQLFSKEIPPFDIVNKVLSELINKDLNENIYYEFSLKILLTKNITDKINVYIPELKKYYLKCKHKKYLDNLNEKKVITIFRQLLRPYDYIISAIEKYDNGNKYLLYIIQKKNNSISKNVNSILNFD